jgi:hypothetical protein
MHVYCECTVLYYVVLCDRNVYWIKFELQMAFKS